MAVALPLNLLLRGAGVAMLLMVALALWRDHPRALAARLGAAFALSVAAATIGSMPGFAEASDALRAPIAAVAAGSMFVFWLFTRALFQDGFGLRPWHAFAWLALAAIGVFYCEAQPASAAAGMAWVRASGWLLAISPPAWALLAIAQSLADWRDDLVEGRRRLRTMVVATAALYTLAQVLAALLAGLSMKAVVESSANAAGIAVLSLYFGWRLLRAGSTELLGLPDARAGTRTPATGMRTVPAGEQPVAAERAFAPAPGALPATIPEMPSAAALASEFSAADRQQMAALEALMQVERIYRESGLTVGGLAERMGLPEHRLRRLINQGLGHRNFSAFLNGWRLADARRWLSDPQQEGTPILTIAMDAGFQSLGPFNRAFKADTGLTPSEFRRRQGGRASEASPVRLAESEIG